jgi:fumarate reductase subunit C
MNTRIRQNSLTTARDAQRQIAYELISGGSGLVLALFMWGHVVLVGSILTGERGFDWMATMLEDYYVAQPTVAVIFAIFIVHAVFASRKIPAQLQERRQMIDLAKGLNHSGREKLASRQPNSPFVPHLESMLWIWQVRTGMIILVLGSFHLILLGVDVFTPLFGDRVGIESSTSLARVSAGLWLPYAILLLCVEFHASIGLYRLAVKWGSGFLPSRRILHGVEQFIFWLVLGVGGLTLLVLAGWVDPPLEFLLAETAL